jgi:hypothetical protein
VASLIYFPVPKTLFYWHYDISIWTTLVKAGYFNDLDGPLIEKKEEEEAAYMCALLKENQERWI